jgi:hypothetical protein
LADAGIQRGRPKGYSPKEAHAEAVDGDQYQSPATKRAIRKAEAAIQKEEALAKSAALKYEIDSGNYLPRDAFREASATLCAEVAQALRSIPDLLERKANLAPAQVVICERLIDEVQSTLAANLALFTDGRETN